MTVTENAAGPPAPSGPTRLSDSVHSGGTGTGSFGTLLVTELKRVRARRITRFMLLGLAAVLVIIWIGYAYNSRPLSDAEKQQNQSYFDESLTDYQKYCNDDGTVKDGVDVDQSPWGDCTYPPTADQYSYDRSAHFSDLPFASLAFALVAGAAMLLLASSMVGADINSGNLGTQLLFVPQRGRVFLARAAATVVTATAVAVATIGVGSLGMWLVMKQFVADDADAHGNARLWWATGARGILVVIALALTGYAITWILGHTAATIGLAGAWMIFVEQFVASTDQLAGLRPFAPAMNLVAIAQGRGTYSISTCTNSVNQGYSCDYTEKTFSLTHALTLWGVILAVLLAVAMWWFHRKDVT